MKKCDVLIIGCGIAGATAALELTKKGLDVVVLSSGQSNSEVAQGGVVANSELLAKDILAAGAGLCNERAVNQVVDLGPRLIYDLLSTVPFDRNENGEYSFTNEAAHTIPRILHSKDQTGKAIMQTLCSQLQNIEHKTAIDLITLSHHSKKITDIYLPSTCVGAYVLNGQNVEMILARETILATGGLGEVFLHTTNPQQARGDGIAMAYRAGARIMNMEYVQFHPTTLYLPGERRFLLSEALRGEGGRLLNSNLAPFVDELAPRDVVSRALFNEMVRSSSDHLWLDMTMKSKSHLEERFPFITAFCKEKGFDLSREPVPVVPAAHYSCGGVAVDLCGRTTIERLRAVGEVSCTGLHGANRLASTSLLEAIVWGYRAAQDVVENWSNQNNYFPPVAEWHMSHEKVDQALIRQDWSVIKQTMWNYVGLVRDKDRLRRAVKMLGQLQGEIESFYETVELNPELIGLRNGILTAQLISQGAWRNKESLGCHYRIS